MQLDILLARLERLVADSPRLPLTGKAIVDAANLLALAAELRSSLPEDVEEARRIQAERDEILAEARDEALHLMARTEAQAERLIEESVVLTEAQERAEKLVAEAEEVGREIRLRAREYADNVLERVQGHLDYMLETVIRNREDLRR